MRTPEPPPLPEDLEALLRHLRLPHIRRAAPDVLATAKAQRWEPAEVLKALLSEELAGRSAPHLRHDERQRASRAGRPSRPGTTRLLPSRHQPRKRFGHSSGCGAGRTWWSAARREQARASS